MTRSAPATRSPYVILLICGLPFLMETLDGTVVNVALPSIAKELHSSLQSLQWIVSAYILVIASTVIMAGMLADRFGRRRILLIGVVVFTVGSIFCSTVTSEEMLIGMRAFQAIGAAMISPATMSIVTNVFTGTRRATALGWWSVFGSVGLAIGPLIGGLLVQSFGWRSIFWVNVVPGIAAIILLLVFVPESRATRPKPFDPIGQVLLITFVVPLVFVVIETSRLGWTSPFIIGAAAVAVVSLIGLFLYERPKPEALIPVDLFANAAFRTAILTLMCGVLAAGATMFTASLFLQNYRGLTALEAGLFTMPMAVASMVAALLASKLVAKGQSRMVLLFAGATIAVAGLVFWITADGIVWFMLIAFFVMGVGFGALNDPVNVTAISQLPDEKAGLAASLISTSRQFGQVLGVAIAGALIGTGLGADMKSGFAQAAVPVWILLVIAGVVIFVLNALHRTSAAKGAATMKA